MSARLVVFGLDAGDPTTVRELVAAGRMPSMARLLSSGAQYPLTEPRGHSFVAERWTTMVTGVGPDVHRYYSWAEYDKTNGYDRAAPLDPAGVPRLWDRLSSAGCKVAVLDVPRQPLSHVNGIHLCEWGAHDRDDGTCSWPPQLAANLNTQFGEHALGRAAHTFSGQFAPCDVLLRSGPGDRNLAQLSELSGLVSNSLEGKIKVSEHLLGSETWDLFFTVIGETHCATHQFWHLHRPANETDRSQAAVLGNLVTQTFERVDQTLARHIELAGPDAVIVVVLHSGMAPLSGGNELLGEILKRLRSPMTASVFTNRIGALRFPRAATDSECSRALERLRSDLAEVIDDDTGRGAVSALRTRDAYFPGIDDKALPDIFVEWAGKGLINKVSSPKIGKIVKLDAATARTADHTPDGLVVIAGPEIERGVHSPMDPAAFAPQIIRLLGVDPGPAA